MGAARGRPGPVSAGARPGVSHGTHRTRPAEITRRGGPLPASAARHGGCYQPRHAGRNRTLARRGRKG